MLALALGIVAVVAGRRFASPTRIGGTLTVATLVLLAFAGPGWAAIWNGLLIGALIGALGASIAARRGRTS